MTKSITLSINNDIVSLSLQQFSNKGNSTLNFKNYVINKSEQYIDTDLFMQNLYGEIVDSINQKIVEHHKSYSEFMKRVNETTNSAHIITETATIKEILKRDFRLNTVSKTDVLKFRLYQELKSNGYRTLYSNTFVNYYELLTDKFNIDHIIPQSKSKDNTIDNKTLVVTKINQEKADNFAFNYVCKKFSKQQFIDYVKLVNELYNNKLITKAKYTNLLTEDLKNPIPKTLKVAKQTNFTKTKRVTISPDLDINLVVDFGAQTILRKHLQKFGGNKQKAFGDLEKHPVLKHSNGGCMTRVAVWV